MYAGKSSSIHEFRLKPQSGVICAKGRIRMADRDNRKHGERRTESKLPWLIGSTEHARSCTLSILKKCAYTRGCCNHRTRASYKIACTTETSTVYLRKDTRKLFDQGIRRCFLCEFRSSGHWQTTKENVLWNCCCTAMPSRTTLLLRSLTSIIALHHNERCLVRIAATSLFTRHYSFGLLTVRIDATRLIRYPLLISGRDTRITWPLDLV